MADTKINPKSLVIFLSRDNFNCIDAYLPVAVEIFNQKSDRLDLLFITLTTRSHSAITASRFHYALIESIAKHVSLAGFSRLTKPIRLLVLLVFQRIRYPKIITVVSSLPKGVVERALHLLFSMFGLKYLFPTLHTPMTDAYCERFRNWDIMRKMNLKKTSQENALRAGRRQICYLDSEIQHYSHDEGTEFFPIGVPKLYPSWRNEVFKTAPKLMDEELVAVGVTQTNREFGVIILTVPSYFWFESDGDFLTMLSDILDSSQTYFPGMLVFLKAKYQMKARMEVVLRNSGLLGENIKFIDASLASLSAKARWAVSIQESSGVLDFLISGVPTLEYGRYSEAWLEVCPSGSAWKNLPGVEAVSTREGLNDAFARIASEPGRRDNIEALQAHFNHRMDLDLFY